jgi:hypothetical protein
MTQEKLRIAIFAPFSLIHNHQLAEYRVAAALKQEGCEIDFITCKSGLPGFCTVMESLRENPSIDPRRKKEICNSCESKSNAVTDRLKTHKISFYENSNQANQSFELLKIYNEELQDKMFLDVNVGRLALYETLLKFKKTNTNLNQEQQFYFLQTLNNALVTASSTERFLSNRKIDKVILYSPQYAVPGAFAAVAEKFGIECFFMEGSSNFLERYSHIRIWRWKDYGLSQPAMYNLDRFSSYCVNSSAKRRAINQIKTLEKAGSFSVYSSKPKGSKTRDHFEIKGFKKIVLLSMSSYDEVYSAVLLGRFPREKLEGVVFKNQYEWLEKTITWFSSQPDYALIIRPHPRDFPNSRENRFAEHIKDWEAVLENLPNNVFVDAPANNFSIYDHFKEVDLVLTGWSFTGIEALFRGIPVVSYDEKLPSFPATIHLTGSSQESYFRNIKVALGTSTHGINRDLAIKWLAYLLDIGTIKIGGPVEYGVGRNHPNKIKRLLFLRGIYRLYNSFTMFILFRSKPNKKNRQLLHGFLTSDAKSLFDYNIETNF